MFFITAKAHERINKLQKEAQTIKHKPRSKQLASVIRKLARRIDNTKGGSYVHT